jgi:hypothetical protein
MPQPPHDLTSILGCRPEEAQSLLRGKPVTPGELEAVAPSFYNWRRHLRDDHSYWVVTSQAARILRVSPRKVSALLDKGRLPYVTNPSGVRMMRRRDVEARAGSVRR